MIQGVFVDQRLNEEFLHFDSLLVVEILNECLITDCSSVSIRSFNRQMILNARQNWVERS